MKTKRVLRYYCDFCKKSGCGKYAMEQHELYCTMNPNRRCRMCEIAKIEQIPIEELKKVLQLPLEHQDDFGSISYVMDGDKPLQEIQNLTNCPACILSAIRQSGQISYMYEFDYKKECESFFEKLNNEMAEREMRYP